MKGIFNSLGAFGDDITRFSVENMGCSLGSLSIQRFNIASFLLCSTTNDAETAVLLYNRWPQRFRIHNHTANSINILL